VEVESASKPKPSNPWKWAALVGLIAVSITFYVTFMYKIIHYGP
jgi:hypothetical protein